MQPDRTAAREALAAKVAAFPTSSLDQSTPTPRVVSSTDARHELLVADELDKLRARREAQQRLDREAMQSVTLPPLESLRARLARPRSIKAWRINGWQPIRSRVMLTAQYKAGKTSFVANCVAAFVDGGRFLGRDPVSPILGTVCLIDLEMSEDQLTDWYAAHGIVNDDRVLVWALRGKTAALNILDPATRSAIAACLRASGVTYLVLDCLRPLMDALGLDEHRDGGQLLVAFDALLAEANIPDAMVVHHMGHTAERSRGDSRFRDWPDVEWRLVRRDEDPASPRYITAYGRDVDQPESQLDYDPLTRRLTISGGSRRDAKMADTLSVVIDVLKDSPGPMNGLAIKSALKDSEYSRDTIDAALAFGVRTGALLKQDGPRKSKLYRPASHLPSVSGEYPTDSASECPGAYISPDTRTLGPAIQPVAPAPDTQHPGGGNHNALDY